MPPTTAPAPSMTLLATLGGQPQVITFLLDLLLARGEPIDQVVTVYLPGDPRYRSAFERLKDEFRAGSYLGRAIRLRGQPVHYRGQDLENAIEPAQVEAVRQTFQAIFSELKSSHQAVHLGLSGGRRILSFTALSTAALHLTPGDKVWHLFTPPAVTDQAREGALMHAPEGAGLRLIEVQFTPWAAYIPGLAPLMGQVTGSQPGTNFAWLKEEDRTRCQQVWDRLNARPREVLRLFAHGLTRQEIAQRLVLSPDTVDSHRETILNACEEAWEYPAQRLSTRFLLDKFGPYLRSIGEV